MSPLMKDSNNNTHFFVNRVKAKSNEPLQKTIKIGHDPLIGEVIHSYRIESKLNEGGMGVVYLARHISIGKVVCIKVCKKSKKETCERFYKEAKILAKLDQPQSITAYDFGTFEGKPYIIMPYIKGVSLLQLMENKKSLDIKDIISTIIKAASALHTVHRSWIIHQDVKPSNLIIDQQGKVWIIDFGISIDQSELYLNKESQEIYTAGSPLYMAPEQILNKQVDQRTDIYSLGASLYHLIFREPPYKDSDHKTILKKHLRQGLKLPKSHRSCPLELKKVLIKMLAKNPEHRQKSMLEVIRDLKKVLKHIHKNSVNKKNNSYRFKKIVQQVYYSEYKKVNEEINHETQEIVIQYPKKASSTIEISTPYKRA